MKLKIDPQRTTVLLLDVQKDLVDITPGLKQNRVIENMAGVLKAARRRKLPVIHITASVRAGRRPCRLRLGRRTRTSR